MARLLVAAAMVVSVLGALMVPAARADLIIDIKPISMVGPGSIDTVNNRVTVGGAGAVITLGVYANTIGADADTTNDGPTLIQGAILSTAGAGAIRGVIGTIGNVALDAAFDAIGSQVGAANNLDNSGDLDWGGPSQTSASGWFGALSDTQPNPIWNRPGSVTQLIGTFTYTVTEVNVGGSSTTLSWRRRNHSVASANAIWMEDGVAKSAAKDSPTYRAGLSVELLAGGVGPTPANFVMTQASVVLPPVLLNAAAVGTIQARNSGGEPGNFTTSKDGHVASVVPATGGPVPAGGLVDLSVTMDTSDYGVRSGNVTITPNTGGGNVTNVSVTVGRATPVDSGNNLKAFDPANKLRAGVAAGGSYAGLSSKTTAGGNVVGTEAVIRAGSNTGSARTVEMNWRTRADQEKAPGATTPPMPGPGAVLVSDVVDISGMGTNPTDPFVLQMSYSEALLPKPEAELAAGGHIFLAWLDETGPQSQWRWRRAVEGNTGQGSGARSNYQGSWDAFAAAFGTDLGVLLGSWGVDTASNNVWAVLNHNSQYAVVPEPAAWLLLCMAIPGAMLVRRRRK